MTATPEFEAEGYMVVRGGWTRPRILDLFGCEGGGATGYHRAGFEGHQLMTHLALSKGRAT